MISEMISKHTCRPRRVKSGQKGDVYTFMSWEGGVQNVTGYPWPRGTERANEVCVKSGQRGDVHIL